MARKASRTRKVFSGYYEVIGPVDVHGGSYRVRNTYRYTKGFTMANWELVNSMNKRIITTPGKHNAIEDATRLGLWTIKRALDAGEQVHPAAVSWYVTSAALND